LAKYPELIISFIFNEVKNEPFVVIFKVKNTADRYYGNHKLEEYYENIDTFVLNVGAKK
jgi:hypothetical protein